MNSKDNGNLDKLICEAVDIKEKMKGLYASAAAKCTDEIGSSTFKVLERLENEHLGKLGDIRKELARGGGTADSCTYYDFAGADQREITRRILREKKSATRACLDDIAAIETGLQLENGAIDHFLNRLKGVHDPSEREFLNHLISEERSHYMVLADLKFYYIDPEHWLMEKGRTELDGA